MPASYVCHLHSIKQLGLFEESPKMNRFSLQHFPLWINFSYQYFKTTRFEQNGAEVHPQNVQLLDVQLQNVQLQNVHLPDVQLQNVQITKRPDYQTSLLPNVQITKRPVTERPVTKRPH